MGIRTGKEFVESLRDDRTVYVNGERVKDVTEYPPFRGIVATLASLYDMQHERRDELTYPSPRTGESVAASFALAETLEAGEFRARAEEIRADYTLGLMGRMPDFLQRHD
jgi:4-hydroxyphenylacetate 3-monooxygenase